MHPHKVKVVNELHKLQEIVGGNIEVLNIADGILLICDEEGKLKPESEPNIYLPAYRDVIFGPVLIVGERGEDFDSLSKRDQELVFRLLGCWTPNIRSER